MIKNGEMYFHLSGTNYFEEIEHPGLIATKAVWDQPVVSENRDVYRAEYLAFRVLRAAQAGQLQSIEELKALSDGELLAVVQQFMAPRYTEGYVKGVHDHDAAAILRELVQLEIDLELLKYSSRARALANVYWYYLGVTHDSQLKNWSAKLASLSAARKLFGDIVNRQKYVDELTAGIAAMVAEQHVGDPESVLMAANYLFDQHSATHAADLQWISTSVVPGFSKVPAQTQV